MIYIVNEQVMSGTVTISTHNSGIEAENFSDVVNKFKNLKSFKDGKIEIITESEDRFTFSVKQKPDTSMGLECRGFINSEPLKML